MTLSRSATQTVISGHGFVSVKKFLKETLIKFKGMNNGVPAEYGACSTAQPSFNNHTVQITPQAICSLQAIDSNSHENERLSESSESGIGEDNIENNPCK